MKTISIRFDDYLANWITSSAQKNRITISQAIRDVLYEKMQHGQIIISHIKINKTKQFVPSQHYRSEIGYIIFTAKLLEGFVLATNEHGPELKNVAFQVTENILEQLHLNNNKNKEQQFCVNLESELYNWLSQEAVRLQVRIIPLIRKIIEEMALKELNVINSPLHSTQKVGIEHQIIACKLLETLVNKTVDDAANIIEEARSKTKNVLLKLFPEQKISLTCN
jgi:hypothetical protein